MLWIKSLHIIAVIAWYAALFYLPRLFVYHAMSTDTVSRDRFIVMERRLYRGIMMPAMIASVVFGVWLWLGYGITGGWMHAKLVLVAVLLAYHFWMGKIARDFATGAPTRGHVFYRVINEVPTVLLIAIVILAVVKPF
jgi:putative membrane protein